MELNFGKDGLLLLLVAAVVAMLTRRLRLPYSVGLVAAGMALALLPLAPKIFLGNMPPSWRWNYRDVQKLSQ
jgi:Kef-type K+ transport system membrane component KefB